jgi:protein SCO1/2
MSKSMRKVLLVNIAAAGVTLGLLAAFGGWFRGKGTEPLPVLGQVPDFSLIERSGQAVSLADLKRQVWVADFVFTHCAGPCPLLSRRMQSLQEPLADYPGVRLVSFSVDPERDTPDVLAEYAKRYSAGERWLFLTGEKEPLYRLIMDGFKLGVDDGSALTAGVPGPGTITHSTRFVLVDREGRIRAYYDGSSEDIAEQLLPDVQALLRE